MVKGFSQASCETQVQQQVARLRQVLRGVVVMHLMSNRSRERTVVGYWQPTATDENYDVFI